MKRAHGRLIRREINRQPPTEARCERTFSSSLKPRNGLSFEITRICSADILPSYSRFGQAHNAYPSTNKENSGLQRHKRQPRVPSRASMQCLALVGP